MCSLLGAAETVPIIPLAVILHCESFTYIHVRLSFRLSSRLPDPGERRLPAGSGVSHCRGRSQHTIQTCCCHPQDARKVDKYTGSHPSASYPSAKLPARPSKSSQTPAAYPELSQSESLMGLQSRWKGKQLPRDHPEPGLSP